MDSKCELRLKYKNIRKSLDIDKISEALVIKVRNADIYKNAENIMIYYPFGHEINMLGLLNDNKKFYLPKVFNDNLLVCPYLSGDKLVISKFNISEPCTNPAPPDILDLVIVPALSVDGNNYRLGYGGGFYDRFIAKYPDITTLVPIAKELVCEELPVDEFDKRVDFVISF